MAKLDLVDLHLVCMGKGGPILIKKWKKSLFWSKPWVPPHEKSKNDFFAYMSRRIFRVFLKLMEKSGGPTPFWGPRCTFPIVPQGILCGTVGKWVFHGFYTEKEVFDQKVIRKSLFGT